MSLEVVIGKLESVLCSDEPLGPSHDMPFAILLYEPERELQLRRHVKLLETRLLQTGRHVETVDLGGLLWECFGDHPMEEEGLFAAEADSRSVDDLLRETSGLLLEKRTDRPGPLERRVIERLAPLEGDPEVVGFLTRAAELFPFYRTSALLERIMTEVDVRTVLFYPGTMEGSTTLSFMGVCEPSPNYRPRIFA